MPKKPIVLTILDGWGYRAETYGNAIAQARKPTYDALLRDFPNTLLRASEHFVGLPDGQMGNSEVGHLNLGAGRIVRMDMTRIDTAIARSPGEDGSFFSDPTLLRAMRLAAEDHRALHLIGLLSDGGVHSHQRHLYALLRMAKQQGLTRVFVHAFLDGRDTLPTSGLGYLEQLDQQFRGIGTGALASVSGRYFAMDRDFRWEKSKQAFEAMVTGHPEGGAYSDPLARIRDLYSNGITDEFTPPFTVTDAHARPVALIRDQDVVINFNYRADRVRQITRVLTRTSGLNQSMGRDLPKAAELDAAIPPQSLPQKLHYVCMSQYDKAYKLPIVIPAESMDNLLANVMGEAQLRNLRVAETEKYAHVTYFFNGGIEKPFPGEDRSRHRRHRHQGARRFSLRRHHRQLRQRRHGRPLRPDGAHHPRRRNRRQGAWAHLPGHPSARRSHANHRRPWQRRTPDRPSHRRPPHRPHHQPRPLHPGQR